MLSRACKGGAGFPNYTSCFPLSKHPLCQLLSTEKSLSQDPKGPAERGLRNSPSGALGLEQWAPNMDFALRVTLDNVCRRFDCHSWIRGGMVLLVSSRQRPEML